MTIMDIVGLLGAFFTTASFVPQALRVVKTKSTQDLSFGMFSMMTAGIICWLFYGLSKNDLPLILANTVSLVLSMIILAYKLKYK
jgi:MtN3 and saliva related transmembrane protein